MEISLREATRAIQTPRFRPFRSAPRSAHILTPAASVGSQALLVFSYVENRGSIAPDSGSLKMVSCLSETEKPRETRLPDYRSLPMFGGRYERDAPTRPCRTQIATPFLRVRKR